MESLEEFVRGVINDTLDTIGIAGNTIAKAVIFGAVIVGFLIGTAIMMAAYFIGR